MLRISRSLSQQLFRPIDYVSKINASTYRKSGTGDEPLIKKHFDEETEKLKYRINDGYFTIDESRMIKELESAIEKNGKLKHQQPHRDNNPDTSEDS